MARTLGMTGIGTGAAIHKEDTAVKGPRVEIIATTAVINIAIPVRIDEITVATEETIAGIIDAQAMIGTEPLITTGIVTTAETGTLKAVDHTVTIDQAAKIGHIAMIATGPRHMTGTDHLPMTEIAPMARTGLGLGNDMMMTQVTMSMYSSTATRTFATDANNTCMQTLSVSLQDSPINLL
jgi:hypothetical protein